METGELSCPRDPIGHVLRWSLLTGLRNVDTFTESMIGRMRNEILDYDFCHTLRSTFPRKRPGILFVVQSLREKATISTLKARVLLMFIMVIEPMRIDVQAIWICSFVRMISSALDFCWRLD